MEPPHSVLRRFFRIPEGLPLDCAGPMGLSARWFRLACHRRRCMDRYERAAVLFIAGQRDAVKAQLAMALPRLTVAGAPLPLDALAAISECLLPKEVRVPMPLRLTPSSATTATSMYWPVYQALLAGIQVRGHEIVSVEAALLRSEVLHLENICRYAADCAERSKRAAALVYASTDESFVCLMASFEFRVDWELQ